MQTKNIGNWYLAIDQGGHATRAIVFDHNGLIIDQAIQEVEVYYPHLHWVEQSSTALLNSTIGVIREIEQKLAQNCSRVCAAGLATQRSNIVCWHRENGQALSPAISWQDRRAHEWLRSYQDYSKEIHRSTGLLITSHYGASKLRWCLDNLPAVKAAFEAQELAWGPLASYLISQITLESQNLVDPANASRTLLWDLTTMDWHPKWLALFGVPRNPLPKCVPTIYDYGHIRFNKQDLPLKVVTGDQSAAIFAFGKPKLENVYINMGTGAFMQKYTAEKVVFEPGLLSGIIYSDGLHSSYVLEATINGAGCALSSIEQSLGITYAHAEKNFNNWLADVGQPPLFLNGIAGLGAPYWVPDFKSQFIGDGTVEQKIVAVAESILFLIRVNLDLLNQLATKTSAIVVTGGLALYDGLCQRLANICQIPVYRPVECEATARGTAYLLAGCPSHWHNNISGQWFQPHSDEHLLKRFQCWEVAMRDSLAQ